MYRQFVSVLFSAALLVVALPLAASPAQAATTLKTQATPSVTLGNPISDTATLSGATPNATGTITFKLYGPFTSQDPSTDTCVDSGAGANLVKTLGPVNIGSPNASDYVVSSGNFTPTVAGRYQWIASYTSGDTNVNANASTACLDANEASVVNQKQLSISTQATSPVTIGNPISDTATLDVPNGTTGDIVFKLYGPFTTAPTSTDCTAAKEITEASSTKTVPDDEDPAGSGQYTSDPYTPTEAGIYNWTATFTPDPGQGVDPSGEIGCGETAEQSVVNGEAPTTPTLTTKATPSVRLGDPISDTATLSRVTSDATGTITFTVYGPDDEDCSGDPAFTSEVDVNGEGKYGSEEFVPSAAGTYRWTAQYSGDDNNEPLTSECNAENEQSVVNEGGGGGGGGGGNNDHNNNRNRHHNNRHHHNRHQHNRHQHNRFHHNRHNNANAVTRQYEKTVEDKVIKETIPNKGRLAATGGIPLAGVALLSLALVGLGFSILRSAIRRER